MEAEGVGARTRVLLVDDDIVLRGIAVRTLEHAGFEVTAVESGEEALALMEHQPVDLLLLDVMMPGLDGYEVCARLRGTPRGRRLPILMLTGLNDTESIEAAFRAGATDFVTKPINWTLLGYRIRYGLRASALAEAALRTSEQLAQAQRLAHLGTWEWVPERESLWGSQELLRILGRDDAAPQALTWADLLDPVDPVHRDAVARARTQALRDGRPYQLQFPLVPAQGPARVVFEQAVPARDESGQVVKVTATLQDITERVQAEQRIRELERNDELTGLPNRAFFGELVQSTLERASHLRSECAVMFISLDRFKGVNDILGHAGGDAMLREMAQRLRQALEGTAMPAARQPGRALAPVLSRVGGDGFGVLLHGLFDDREAAAVAQALLRAVSEPVPLGDQTIVVTASAGISLFPRDARTGHDLIRKAEQAMYAAKDAGRARWCFFNEEINREASRRVALEQDLRRALAQSELQLYYQPKVDARTGSVVGAEALLRWWHPQRGLVPAEQFIPLAEGSGLIVALGDWVLQTACEALQRWRQQGLQVLPISINLASPSFSQTDLLGQLDRLVEQTQLHTHEISFEITESILMSDVDRTLMRLHELKGRGVGLSLDDFGTGFSSLSYLNRFPIDELKIDRAFVQDVARGGRDAAIAGAIIALGRQFGLRVVAEGVETAEQSQALLALGCPLQQGYLFAHPQPEKDFVALLPRAAG